MRALVISGGGSKGAYAGGVAEHLIRIQKRNYDIFVGTSTGSLLLPHLAAGKVDKLYKLYTHVNQNSIFSINPFKIKHKGKREYVSINLINVLRQLARGKRTFGESENLKKLIKHSITQEEFEFVKTNVADLVITVSNLTSNKVEYKSIKTLSYDEFIDWVWISCNYVPFMSLAKRHGCEYADGGFGSIVPIREAINRGATTIDAIILQSENVQPNQELGRNPFSLMMSLFRFMLTQVENGNVIEGDLVAKAQDITLNLYYTPSKLTENSLIFDAKLMSNWWQQGFDYAAEKAANHSIDAEKEPWWQVFFQKLRNRE